MTRTAVVIAARDPGMFLIEALDSVAAQTVPPDVVVVVDDGSASDEVAAATEGRRVIYLRQEPRGRAIARNRGFESTAADTDAVLFLDADDRLRPAALEVLGEALTDPSIDLVHGATFEFADTDLPPGPGVRRPAGVVQVRLGGATLLRRHLWDRVGPLDPTLPRGEWIEWMDRAYEQGVRAATIADVVLERRLHAHNRTAGPGENDHYVKVAQAALTRRRARGRDDVPPGP